MLKTVLSAAAATCILAATPSIAAPLGAAAAPVEGAAVAPEVAPLAATRRTHETRYCVIETITGSIIPKKECHTRAEWIDLTGADPLKQN